MVLPYTYTDELQRSRRFGANVQVNLAGTATPAIKTAKETASTGEKSGDTNATGVTKGTTDSKTQGTQPTSSATAPSSSIAAPGQANKHLTRTDPIQLYRTATALYQEIKILNNYLSSTDYICGYTPYLVRLSITIQPYKHDQPVDAYVTLLFRDETDQSQQTGRRSLKVIPLFQTDNLERSQSRR